MNFSNRGRPFLPGLSHLFWSLFRHESWLHKFLMSAGASAIVRCCAHVSFMEELT